jgi:hypothetical protein
MRYIPTVLAFLGFTIGCGGLAESDFGQTDAALMFAPSGAVQPGFKPDTETACLQGVENASQNCIIPAKKAIRYYVDAANLQTRGHIRGEIAEWYEDMVDDGLDQSINGWLVSETTNISDQHLTLVVAASPSAAPAACVAPEGRTRRYSCFTGSTTGVPDIGLQGTYHQWVNVPVLHVDYAEIYARPGLTALQRGYLVRQAVRSGLERFGGVGLVSTGDDRCNTVEEQVNVKCQSRPQTACRLNGFGDVGGDTLWIGGTNCGN